MSFKILSALSVLRKIESSEIFPSNLEELNEEHEILTNVPNKADVVFYRILNPEKNKIEDRNSSRVETIRGSGKRKRDISLSDQNFFETLVKIKSIFTPLLICLHSKTPLQTAIFTKFEGYNFSKEQFIKEVLEFYNYYNSKEPSSLSLSNEKFDFESKCSVLRKEVFNFVNSCSVEEFKEFFDNIPIDSLSIIFKMQEKSYPFNEISKSIFSKEAFAKIIINKTLKTGLIIQDGRGNSLLHLAIKMLYVDLVMEIVEKIPAKGLEINNNFGFIPLHQAIKKYFKHLAMDKIIREIEKKMIANGLTTRTKKTNNVFLEVAIKNHEEDTAITNVETMPAEDLTIQNKKKNTSLHLAIENRLMNLIQKIVNKIPSEGLTVQNCLKFTPLHKAILHGFETLAIEIVEKMPAEGLTIQDYLGASALHKAISHGFEALAIKIIEKMPAEGLKIQDSDGYTALHKAILQGFEVLAIKILEKMPAVGLKIQDSDGYTALHIAILHGFEALAIKIVEKMPAEGLTIQHSDGYTALHIAILHGFEALAIKIVEKISAESLIIQHSDGHTLSHGFKDLAIKTIETMPAEGLTIQNEKTHTPLELAKEKGYVKLVEKIEEKLSQ